MLTGVLSTSCIITWHRSYKILFQIKVSDDSDEEDEPDEVSQAWEDLVYLQKEQQRYTDMREQVEKEMMDCKAKGQDLEEVRVSRNCAQWDKPCIYCLCSVSDNKVILELCGDQKINIYYKLTVLIDPILKIVYNPSNNWVICHELLYYNLIKICNKSVNCI